MYWVISCSLFLFTSVCSQSMDGYYTYDEFLDKVKDYDYDYLSEKSHGRREIPYIKLSNSDGMENRKSILLVGGLNASPIALSQLFWNIDQLIYEDEENIQISALLKTNHIYIVPMLNIDGYRYVSDNWDNLHDVGSTDTKYRKNGNEAEC